MHRICVCLIAFGLLVPAFGQTVLATLGGDVADPSGKAVAGAAIAVRGRETGRTVAGVSGSDGSFTITALPAGSYDVSFSARGFKVYERPIELAVGPCPAPRPRRRGRPARHEATSRSV
ncbi:MAG: carboxypeptidase regulatory-like domain-containing protein [Bryobacterales bacterium]|nr:carboxypeptidase regulatory-like domain-containing protein [Bryobacterales bacterium]